MTAGSAQGFGQRLRALFSRSEPDIVAPEPPEVTVESGHFTHGRCDSCGWMGPGRRARGVAVHDAELHRLAGCGEGVTLPEATRALG